MFRILLFTKNLPGEIVLTLGTALPNILARAALKLTPPPNLYATLVSLRLVEEEGVRPLVDVNSSVVYPIPIRLSTIIY